MNVSRIIDYWKYPTMLLVGIGISSIGSWIYFLALNVIVFNMTESPIAVSALYIIKPLATLFTNLWGGSVIDRVNKKHLMVVLNIIQATLITCLVLLLHTLWAIYLLVFLINIATSIYDPTSVSYITRLIPKEQRQRFNSLRSLLDSGAFLLGPAIAAGLFLLGTPLFAIIVNALCLYFSAIIILLMPNVEKINLNKKSTENLSFRVIKDDLKVVIQFSHRFRYVMIIYFLFSVFVVLQTGVDSLEVAFAKEVISLSDAEYYFLVSTAGAGILMGSLVNAIFTNRLKVSYMIGIGSVMVSFGYIIFALSFHMLTAYTGVFILAFSLAFANTGFNTFYQNNVPVEIMGRIGSVYGFMEALLVITITSIFALGTLLLPLRTVVVSGVLCMLILTSLLLFLNMQSTKKKYYEIQD